MTFSTPARVYTKDGHLRSHRLNFLLKRTWKKKTVCIIYVMDAKIRQTLLLRVQKPISLAVNTADKT